MDNNTFNPNPPQSNLNSNSILIKKKRKNETTNERMKTHFDKETSHMHHNWSKPHISLKSTNGLILA